MKNILARGHEDRYNAAMLGRGRKLVCIGKSGSTQAIRQGVFAICWILAAAACLSMAASEAEISSAEDSKALKAAVIVCHDTIDDGLYQSIIRRSEEAIQNGAEYLILDVSTYGGLVKSADDISKYLILEIADRAHTVAYVSTEAISAGAMISTSCKDIIMRENTNIGCSAPITPGAELEGAEREKVESFVRATFSRAAEANNYPEALLRAMVSQDLEVWQIRNTQTDEAEYFEKEYLPTDPNSYDLKNKKLIVKEGELLTLTASKAEEYGIARAVVSDLDEALAFLENRDEIKFERPLRRMETNWSEEMVRFLNSPAVVSILILGILLGVYVEFNTPGLGLPGLLAVTCLVILVGSKYLIGLANWVEVAILILGILLLLIEIFVIPGFGVAGFSGILCIFIGLFAILIKNAPDELPWPQDAVSWAGFRENLFSVAIGFLVFMIIAIFFTKYIDRIPFLKSFILQTASERQTFSASRSGAPEEIKINLQVGHKGMTISPLRPAGKGQFAGSVVDIVTDGTFVEKDKPIKIMKIEGNRIVVREIENA